MLDLAINSTLIYKVFFNFYFLIFAICTPMVIFPIYLAIITAIYIKKSEIIELKIKLRVWGLTYIANFFGVASIINLWTSVRWFVQTGRYSWEMIYAAMVFYGVSFVVLTVGLIFNQLISNSSVSSQKNELTFSEEKSVESENK